MGVRLPRKAITTCPSHSFNFLPPRGPARDLSTLRLKSPSRRAVKLRSLCTELARNTFRYRTKFGFIAVKKFDGARQFSVLNLGIHFAASFIHFVAAFPARIDIGFFGRPAKNSVDATELEMPPSTIFKVT
jgi:hypothetical protein